MPQAILELIRQRDHVSFAELSQEIPQFKGDLTMTQRQGGNLILWDGISQEATDAIKQLLDTGLIYMETTPRATYIAFDGGDLGAIYDLAKTVREYATPRWLPIVFRPGPQP